MHHRHLVDVPDPAARTTVRRICELGWESGSTCSVRQHVRVSHPSGVLPDRSRAAAVPPLEPLPAGNTAPVERELVAPDTLHGVSTPPPLPESTGTTPDQREPDDRLPGDRELADIPAGEVISRAAVMLMSAAAEQLGLASADPDDPEHRDLDEARTLITALAGLLQASLPDLGPHAAAFREGLQSLQKAFREYSIFPDEPGTGPGENLGRRAAH